MVRGRPASMTWRASRRASGAARSSSRPSGRRRRRRTGSPGPSRRPVVTPQTVLGEAAVVDAVEHDLGHRHLAVERLAAGLEVDRLAPGTATRRRPRPAACASSVRKSSRAGAAAAAPSGRRSRLATAISSLPRARAQRLGQRGQRGPRRVECGLLPAERADRLDAGGAGRGRKRASAADSARAQGRREGQAAGGQFHLSSVVRARRRFARADSFVSNALFPTGCASPADR